MRFERWLPSGVGLQVAGSASSVMARSIRLQAVGAAAETLAFLTLGPARMWVGS